MSYTVTAASHKKFCTAATARPRGPHPLLAHRTGTTAGTTAGKQCVVLGGGIGGLVTAAKLAQCGYRVTLAEQGNTLGGRCQSITVHGYR